MQARSVKKAVKRKQLMQLQTVYFVIQTNSNKDNLATAGTLLWYGSAISS